MTATKTTIQKRDGTTEEPYLEKMHKVVFYVRVKITGVSEVEIKSRLQSMMELKVQIFKKH